MIENTPEELAAFEQFKQNALQNPGILAQLEQLPPIERQALLEQMFMDYQGQEALAAEELAFATSEANVPMPEGRMAGRIYVAPNPLEYLGATLRNVKGTLDRNKAMDRLEELSKSRTAGTRGVADLVSRSNAVPEPQNLTPQIAQPMVGPSEETRRRLREHMMRTPNAI